MPRWFEVSRIRTRSALWLLVVLIPPAIVAVWIETEWRRHERADAAADAVRWAGYLAAQHELLVDGSRQRLDAAAHVVTGLPADEALRRRVLAGFLEMGSHYLEIGLARLDGQVVVSSRPTTGGSVGDQAWFRRAVDARAFTLGDYETDPLTGRHSLTVAAPALDDNGRLAHVIYGVVDVGWLAEIATEARLPEGTIVAVIDGNGAIVPRAPGREGSGGFPSVGALRAAIAGRPEAVVEARSEEGVSSIYGMKAVSTGLGPGWVAVGIPMTAATAKAEGLLLLTLAGFGLAGLMAAGIAVMGTEVFFLRPLDRIVGAAQRLSRGDLDARTGMKRTRDELQQLGASFDEMAEALQRRDRDLTAQHEAFAAQSRRYHALVEQSSDGVVLIDRDERILYASPSTLRIIGCAVDDLIGHSTFDRVHPDDRERMRETFADVIGQPATPRLATFRAKHGDGSWRCIEVVATNLLDEPSVGAVVGNYRDITERRKAEDALRRAHEELETRVEERTAALVSSNAALAAEVAVRASIERALRKLSLAIEQTADCVMIASCDGVIEYVNPAFETLTGYARHEAVGARTNLVRSGRHSDAFYQAMWKRITAGEVFSAVFVNRAKDGRLYYEDQTITPIRNPEGVVTHYVSTGRDITQRKRTEEALRRLHEQLENEAKRIASALHDEAGRFLMTAHITLADVARELPPEIGGRLREVRRDLDQVEEQLRRLSHELRPRVLDDLGLVEALKFLGEGVMRRTGVNVSIEASLNGRYPQLVETALYRMVQEALTNIGKHAQATRATVVLEQQDHMVCCSIRDDGRGFDVSGLNRAGESSLGLVGIRDRLEAVGGTLEIVSMPGGGTELRTAVPLEAT